MRPRRSTIPFLVLLAPVVFVGSALAPADSAAAAPGNIVWDSSATSPDRTTRSLRFRVNPPVTATGAPGQDAIKVTMIDLQNPVPPNAPRCPPPNFGCWEAGAACGSVVPDGPNVRACTGTGEANGCARWVGKPATFLEVQNQPTWGKYRVARLQCTPYYETDWVAETAGKVCAGGTLSPQSRNGEPCDVITNPRTAPATCIDKKITVVGAEILPSSKYSVRTYGSLCAGSDPASCTDLGTPVPVYTRRHGDVAPVFTPPDVGQPGTIDVAEILRGLGKLGPLRKAGAKIYPNLPEENIDLDVGDLGRVVDAALGYAYPASESGPCPCPPVHPLTGLALLCGVTACACDANSGPCVACGGGQCIRTCMGGENAGLACRDSVVSHGHCPGGCCGSGCTITPPTVGSGSCRDKCGRCK